MILFAFSSYYKYLYRRLLSRQRRLRTIAAILAIAMMWQDVSLAYPERTVSVPVASALSPQTSFAQTLDPSHLSIPFGQGFLTEAHTGSNGKCLILIQDAHANYSGQTSLAGILDFFMARYKKYLVLVEGSSRDVTLDRLKGIADEKTWKIAARQMLQKNVIAGEEYLNLTSNYPIRLRGIEDQRLYDRSLAVYSKLTQKRQAVLQYLHRIRISLDRLKNRLYPAAILDHEERLKADPSFQSRLSGILDLAEKAGISLESYPELELFQKAQSSEQALDFKRLNAEQELLITALRSKKHEKETEDYLQSQKKGVPDLFAQAHQFDGLLRLAEESGIALKEYPELEKYRKHLETLTRMDVEALIIHSEELLDEIYRRLLPEENARKVRAVERFVELLERAYRIELTSYDFKTLRINEGDFDTASWEAFVNGELIKLDYFEDLIPYKEHLEKAAHFLKAFYRLVDLRDKAFLANTAKILAEENATSAFMVVGGYHTEHLKSLLKIEGYSYAVLTPHISSETDKGLYEKILLASLTQTHARTMKQEGFLNRTSVAAARLAGLNLYDISESVLVREAERPEPVKPVVVQGARLAGWIKTLLLPATLLKKFILVGVYGFVYLLTTTSQSIDPSLLLLPISLSFRIFDSIYDYYHTGSYYDSAANMRAYAVWGLAIFGGAAAKDLVSMALKWEQTDGAYDNEVYEAVAGFMKRLPPNKETIEWIQRDCRPKRGIVSHGWIYEFRQVQIEILKEANDEEILGIAEVIFRHNDSEDYEIAIAVIEKLKNLGGEQARSILMSEADQAFSHSTLEHMYHPFLEALRGFPLDQKISQRLFRMLSEDYYRSFHDDITRVLVQGVDPALPENQKLILTHGSLSYILADRARLQPIWDRYPRVKGFIDRIEHELREQPKNEREGLLNQMERALKNTRLRWGELEPDQIDHESEILDGILSGKVGKEAVIVIPTLVDITQENNAAKSPAQGFFKNAAERALQAILQGYREEIEIIQEGGFDIHNPVHVSLNYLLLVRTLEDSNYARGMSYKEFMHLIQEVKKGNGAKEIAEKEIDADTQRQIRGLVYEGHLLREEILALKKRADKLGRPLVVIENLSYGAVATSPITEERAEHKYILGTDIRVIGTKVGSTESHHNEFVINDLLRPAEAAYVLRHKPIIVVVDGSTSVASPDRTSPHIPDAFKGYRNYFIALDWSLGIAVKPGNFHLDREFLKELSQQPKVTKIKQKLKNEEIQPETSEPYKLFFWYPGRKDLYQRIQKKKNVVAEKVNPSDVKGPSLIFMQSGIEPEAVPDAVRDAFIQGRHNPVHFDDRDHFKQFYLDYEKGYGIVLSQRFRNLARRYYYLYSELFDVPISSKKPPVFSRQAREVDAVVMDLDGTAASTDEPLPPPIQKTIIALLQKGKKIVFLTEDIERNMSRRVTNLIPVELRRGVSIFSDGGASGHTFDAAGRPIYFDDHNTASVIRPKMKRKVLEFIGRHYGGQFQPDSRPERVSPRYRIDLNQVKVDRNSFVRALAAFFQKKNLPLKAYKAGRTSVKIVRQHKEHALKYWLNRERVDEARALVIADAAHVNDIDRELLSQFPRAVTVNVGSYSKTIGDLNPGIVQFADEHVAGTLKLLKSLDIHGKLPLAGISGLASTPSKPAHLEDTDLPPQTPQTVARILRTKSASPIVGVIGATVPSDGYSQPAAKSLGNILRDYLDAKGTFFTGGVAGVGEHVFEGFAAKPGLQNGRFFVLLPDGTRRAPEYEKLAPANVGVPIENFGKNMFERRIGMGLVADVLIVLNGGPGTLHEAAEALKNGKNLLVMNYGGAGGALYQAKTTGRLTQDLVKAGIMPNHLGQIHAATLDSIAPTLDLILKAGTDGARLASDKYKPRDYVLPLLNFAKYFDLRSMPYLDHNPKRIYKAASYQPYQRLSILRMSFLAKEMVRASSKRVPLIVEFGAGTGFASYLLAREGNVAIGIEQKEEVVRDIARINDLAELRPGSGFYASQDPAVPLLLIAGNVADSKAKLEQLKAMLADTLPANLKHWKNVDPLDIDLLWDSYQAAGADWSEAEEMLDPKSILHVHGVATGSNDAYRDTSKYQSVLYWKAPGDSMLQASYFRLKLRSDAPEPDISKLKEIKVGREYTFIQSHRKGIRQSYGSLYNPEPKNEAKYWTTKFMDIVVLDRTGLQLAKSLFSAKKAMQNAENLYSKTMGHLNPQMNVSGSIPDPTAAQKLPYDAKTLSSPLESKLDDSIYFLKGLASRYEVPKRVSSLSGDILWNVLYARSQVRLWNRIASTEAAVPGKPVLPVRVKLADKSLSRENKKRFIRVLVDGVSFGEPYFSGEPIQKLALDMNQLGVRVSYEASKDEQYQLVTLGLRGEAESQTILVPVDRFDKKFRNDLKAWIIKAQQKALTPVLDQIRDERPRQMEGISSSVLPNRDHSRGARLAGDGGFVPRRFADTLGISETMRTQGWAGKAHPVALKGVEYFLPEGYSVSDIQSRQSGPLPLGQPGKDRGNSSTLGNFGNALKDIPSSVAIVARYHEALFARDGGDRILEMLKQAHAGVRFSSEGFKENHLKESTEKNVRYVYFVPLEDFRKGAFQVDEGVTVVPVKTLDSDRFFDIGVSGALAIRFALAKLLGEANGQIRSEQIERIRESGILEAAFGTAPRAEALRRMIFFPSQVAGLSQEQIFQRMAAFPLLPKLSLSAALTGARLAARMAAESA